MALFRLVLSSATDAIGDYYLRLLYMRGDLQVTFDRKR